MIFQDPGFSLPELPAAAEALREEVRGFLDVELKAGSFEPCCNAWMDGHEPEFSRKLARRGWIGMTWPRKYGGQERSVFENFVVNEELLAVGAPVAAHWAGVRQTGPLLMRFGNDAIKDFFLARMARAEIFFSIGLSEPDAGSDLAQVRTRARRIDGGWVINGRKIWSSGAHRADFMVVFCRTGAEGEADRRAGFSQLIVDLKAPGITIRPIYMMSGAHHFNETIFDDVFVADDRLIGKPGEGWSQVVSELGYERSGPERFMSIFPLLAGLVRIAAADPELRRIVALGQLTARLWTLRRMSIALLALLAKGESPEVEAALVKDLGTRFERETVEIVRGLAPPRSSDEPASEFDVLLAKCMLAAPAFTLRGGTNEILRNVIARSLGLR
ncbi:acyl-CoA dehydrogenase family protein [Piscinibacter sakaiensis]|uniref:acyl-CoA dehydrogenase family protein n=1 Tax=Piscinibacter sakaiensis TaxID=1547922 RepID=UPI003AB0E71B